MKLTGTILFVLLSFIVHAQDFPAREPDLQNITDNIAGQQDTDLNDGEVYENLLQLLSNPVDLNTATTEDFSSLPVLTPAQAAQLVAYRQSVGDFLSVYELQAVPELDLATVYRLMPFVQVRDPAATLNRNLWTRIREESDNYFLFRMERTWQTRQGFKEQDTTKRFMGSPDKLYLRFRSSRAGDYSFGFTLEKDPGESMVFRPAGRQYGFDYVSFHAQVQNKGRIKNLVVGDYQRQFGQGIILGGVFGMGKGGETITTIRRSNIGFLPYTSAFENGQLRGVAATVQLWKRVPLFLSGSYSCTRRDSRVDSTGNDDIGISSFQSTGLHRNLRELATRKTTGENNVATVIHYQTTTLDAGIILNTVVFDNIINKAPTVYNQFQLRDARTDNTGVYLNYTLNNLSFFSEVAQTSGHGHACVAGVLWSLSRQVDLSILHRTYQKDFYTFYSNGFSENTTPQNERGTYWGLKYTVNRRLNIAGYVDMFRFPWLRFRSYQPSEGHEILGRINYQPSRKILTVVQMREESKMRNHGPDSTQNYITAPGVKNNFLLSFDYTCSDYLRLKTRAQWSRYTIGQRTRGMAIMQDISARIRRLEVTARYALFDTDDYDNRQYTYENDVWLAYSMPAYYGKGFRTFLLLEYKFNRYVSLWLRYSHTRYLNVSGIGSGMDATEGPDRHDLKMQTRLKF